MNMIKPLSIAAMSAILLAATSTEAQAQRVRIKSPIGPVKKIDADFNRGSVHVKAKRGPVKVQLGVDRNGGAIQVKGKRGPLRGKVTAEYRHDRHDRRAQRHHRSDRYDRYDRYDRSDRHRVIPVAHTHCSTTCYQQTTRGHYVVRPQRVVQPGRYVYENRTVRVPGRWQVTYKDVTVPGYYKTVAKRVTTPGHWVRTRKRSRSSASINLGRHVRIDLKGKRRRGMRWVPPCTTIVHEKVWVAPRCERRAVRTWIQPCTRVQKVKVWQKPCTVTQNVRVYVPGRTSWVCNTRPRRVIKHPRRHRRADVRVGVNFGR